ncbi:hypothetical protein CsatB_015356 [Cannabis sativa]
MKTKPSLIQPCFPHGLIAHGSHPAGCTTVLLSLARLVIGVTNSKDHNVWLALVACVAGYVVVDLVSGLYHWAVDNYGSASTPIFGNQAKAFQLHHELPMRITKHEFVNRTHPFASIVTFILLPIHIFLDHPIIHGFVFVFFGCAIFASRLGPWNEKSTSATCGCFARSRRLSRAFATQQAP